MLISVSKQILTYSLEHKRYVKMNRPATVQCKPSRLHKPKYKVSSYQYRRDNAKNNPGGLEASIFEMIAHSILSLFGL